MSKLIFEEESYVIRGAAFEVYGEMGSGYAEPVYQECMERELGMRNVPFMAQQPVLIAYKGEPLTQEYKPDLLCYEKIIVELKAVEKLNDRHRSQVLNYLKATGLRLGFLINLGSHPNLEIERFAR